MVIMHYFFDPMCGWCYGATPLIQVLASLPAFDMVYHPGGMIPRRVISSSFRQHILQADARITEQTQMIFGEAYKSRVANDEAFTLDSFITTRAFLAGKKMGVKPHLMLKAIQEEHYQKGKRLDQPETLKNLALSLGLNSSEWDLNMTESKSYLDDELKSSHTLMKKFNVSGYPTLVAEFSGGYRALSISTYYGDTPAWMEHVKSLV